APIEELEARSLDALVSIGPRAPADGAGDHHQQSDAQTMRCKHRLSFSGWWGKGCYSVLSEVCESPDLLTANSRYKKLQEAVSVNIHADFCIGRNFVDALDHIAVSVKDIALNQSAAISHGFAARELTPSLDVHVHLLHFD